MQATFNDPPPAVMVRTLAEFALAARKDMGDPGTSIAPVDIFTPKLADLFGEDPASYNALTMPLDEVYRTSGWNPPWSILDGAGPG